jgi:hypothetical protein
LFLNAKFFVSLSYYLHTFFEIALDSGGDKLSYGLEISLFIDAANEFEEGISCNWVDIVANLNKVLKKGIAILEIICGGNIKQVSIQAGAEPAEL